MKDPESLRWNHFKKLEVHSNGKLVDILIFYGLPRSYESRFLKTDLVENFPSARILTWGSNDNLQNVLTGPPAKVANLGHQILLQLRDERTGDKERQKPIILVGPALGGLILKTALLIAVQDPDLQSVIECVQAVLFVGTPHREDGGQDYDRILVNAARYMHTQSFQEDLWNCLHDNSDDFRKLTSAWHLLPNFPIYSFYETKPTDGFDGALVTKHSATLGVQNEVHLPLNATHFEMNEIFDEEKAPFSTDEFYSGLNGRDETSAGDKSAYQIVYETLEILTRREHLQKRYPVSRAQTDPLLPPLSSVLEDRCPVCISLPRGDMPAGLDAPRLEWTVEMSASFARQLRVWGQECSIAEATYLILKHFRPYDGITSANCRRQTSPAPNLIQSTLGKKEESGRATRPEDFLPTRLLDIRDLGHLRLCEQEGLQESGVDQYATLSHCWGSSRSFLTTKESLSRMKRGFGISQQMPKTFRDAILVTHELGVPYIWIDSLCIIQDDIADWDREASDMARVYTNAYLNLAALDADDDAKGFLHPRPFPYTTLTLTFPTGEFANVYLNEVEEDPKPPPPEREHPLKTRGWVLQEQYLSSRILWFSSTEMGWNCKNETIVESGIGLGFRAPDLGSTRWRDVFTDFSHRGLTYDTDKLPALAGVASAFSTLSSLSGKD
ncbi:HET-domain-containing, partial [Fusarium albosuccineum]